MILAFEKVGVDRNQNPVIFKSTTKQLERVVVILHNFKTFKNVKLANELKKTLI